MTFSELDVPSPRHRAAAWPRTVISTAPRRYFTELAADPGGPDRAQAAVGLAVVLEESGTSGSPSAARHGPLGTGHPEFAAQAACLSRGASSGRT